MRAGSYPMRFSPSLAMAAATAVTNGPLATFTRHVDLLGGLYLVARVGEEDGFAAQNQQAAIAAGEAGEVAEVGAERHQQAVQFAFREAGGHRVPALVEWVGGSRAS